MKNKHYCTGILSTHTRISLELSLGYEMPKFDNVGNSNIIRYCQNCYTNLPFFQQNWQLCYPHQLIISFPSCLVGNVSLKKNICLSLCWNVSKKKKCMRPLLPGAMITSQNLGNFQVSINSPLDQKHIISCQPVPKQPSQLWALCLGSCSLFIFYFCLPCSLFFIL